MIVASVSATGDWYLEIETTVLPQHHGEQSDRCLRSRHPHVDVGGVHPGVCPEHDFAPVGHQHRLDLARACWAPALIRPNADIRRWAAT
jgi:hypothetical protein